MKWCIDTISECPVWNFWELTSKGNHRAIMRFPICPPKAVKQAAKKLLTEYYELVGMPTNYMQWVAKMQDYAISMLEYYEGKEDMIANAVHDLAQANEIKKQMTGDPATLEELVATVSKKMGFYVDPKTTSVAAFFQMAMLKTE